MFTWKIVTLCVMGLTLKTSYLYIITNNSLDCNVDVHMVRKEHCRIDGAEFLMGYITRYMYKSPFHVER